MHFFFHRELDNGSSKWLSTGMFNGLSAFQSWTAAERFLAEPMNSYSLLPCDYQPWLYSITAATLIGLAGVLPVAFIPADYEEKRKRNGLYFLLFFTTNYHFYSYLSPSITIFTSHY